MDRFVRASGVVIAAVAAITVVLLLVSPAETHRAGAGPLPTTLFLDGFDGIWAGPHSGGGGVIIRLTIQDSTHGTADILAVDVPLAEPACPSETRDIAFFDQELFNPGFLFRFQSNEADTSAFAVLKVNFVDGQKEIGGGVGVGFPPTQGDIEGGESTSTAAASPSRTSRPGCESTVSFDLRRTAQMQGDIDCSWRKEIREYFDEEDDEQDAQIQADAPPNVPGLPDLEDLTRLLRALADLEQVGDDVDEPCPEPGEQTPAGVIFGDLNCDDVFEPLDALQLLRSDAFRRVPPLPTPAPIPDCPRLGQFYDSGG